MQTLRFMQIAIPGFSSAMLCLLSGQTATISGMVIQREDIGSIVNTPGFAESSSKGSNVGESSMLTLSRMA